jgi:hypothetical protein
MWLGLSVGTEHCRRYGLKDVETILDAHYLDRDIALAEIRNAKARSENKTVNRPVNQHRSGWSRQGLSH